MKSVVWIISVLGVARAASDFSGNPHTSAPYVYSEINSLEYDVETDHQLQNDSDEHAETSSEVVRSLSFEGGCFVSAQTIMFNGGGEPLLYMDTALESDEDLSDDEDDEDDGHSSMLSNASLRSKAYAGASAATPPRSCNARRSESTTETAFFGGEFRLKRNQASIRTVLQLIVGSTGSIRASQVSRMLVLGRHFGVRGLRRARL